MATAPLDRIGNASGVLSTMRQLGSVMGIAVLGAVLQNRLTHNVVAGVQALPGVPASVKAVIVKTVSEGGSQMNAPAGSVEDSKRSPFLGLGPGRATGYAAIAALSVALAFGIHAAGPGPVPPADAELSRTCPTPTSWLEAGTAMAGRLSRRRTRGGPSSFGVRA